MEDNFTSFFIFVFINFQDMASHKEYADFIVQKFERLSDVVSIRPMMGEYVIHFAGRVLGFISNDKLLLQPGDTISRLLPEAPREELFPGSKLFYVADDAISSHRLCEIAEAIYDELPISKRKSKKVKQEEISEKHFPFEEIINTL